MHDNSNHVLTAAINTVGIHVPLDHVMLIVIMMISCDAMYKLEQVTERACSKEVQ